VKHFGQSVINKATQRRLINVQMMAFNSAFSMYTSILVCSLSNFLLNEHDDDDELRPRGQTATVHHRLHARLFTVHSVDLRV